MNIKTVIAALSLIAANSAFADFCSVDNFGNVTSCFPSADMCQQWARTSQGRCVLRQGGSPSTGSAPAGGGSDWLGNLTNTLGGVAERQRAAMAEAARRTPPYILLLAPSNYPHSIETVTIIDSTLKTALEMEAGQAEKTWENPSTNTRGGVIVSPGKPNQFGEVCKEFAIGSTSRGGPKGIRGTACRKSGTWHVIGASPMKMRDGKFVEDNEPSSTAPEMERPQNAEVTPTRQTNISLDHINVNGKAWTRCLVGQKWGMPDQAICNGYWIAEGFSSRYQIIKQIPASDLSAMNWRIPTRDELQAFLKLMQSTGRLAEIWWSTSSCEWTNEEVNLDNGYARSGLPNLVIDVRALKKADRCGVRLVSDTPIQNSSNATLRCDNGSCPTGSWCDDETCRPFSPPPSCTSDAQCKSGYRCWKGICKFF